MYVVGSTLDRNFCRAFLLLQDPQISPYQSPTGLGDGLGLSIRPQLGAIKILPEQFCAHTRAEFFATSVSPPSPLSRASRSRYHCLWKRDSLQVTDNVRYPSSIRKKER